MVLEVQWLHSLGEYTTNYQTLVLKFKANGREVILRGLSKAGPKHASNQASEKTTTGPKTPLDPGLKLPEDKLPVRT